MYVGYESISDFMSSVSGMSTSTKQLFVSFFGSIAAGDGLADTMLTQIAEILPTALTVAGAILVVTLGWRLFRNFTKG